MTATTNKRTNRKDIIKERREEKNKIEIHIYEAGVFILSALALALQLVCWFNEPGHGFVIFIEDEILCLCSMNLIIFLFFFSLFVRFGFSFS